VGKGPGSAEGDFIDWLTIKDQAESVAADEAHQGAQAGAGRRADPRLYLRREVREADRGTGGDGGGEGVRGRRGNPVSLSSRLGFKRL